MGLLSRKKSRPEPAYKPVPSDAKTTEQWRSWERSRGCSKCGKKGCDRMNHSYSLCGRCSSPYCNGDACPGGRGRVRNCPDCGRSPHRGMC